jgi:hypothetical protein
MNQQVTRDVYPCRDEEVSPTCLYRVRLRFYQHLDEEERALADEMVEEGWLFRGWLGLLVPIHWPPYVGGDSEGGNQ